MVKVKVKVKVKVGCLGQLTMEPNTNMATAMVRLASIHGAPSEHGAINGGEGVGPAVELVLSGLVSGSSNCQIPTANCQIPTAKLPNPNTARSTPTTND